MQLRPAPKPHCQGHQATWGPRLGSPSLVPGSGGKAHAEKRDHIWLKTHSISSLMALKEKPLPQSLGAFQSFPELRLLKFPDSHHSLTH